MYPISNNKSWSALTSSPVHSYSKRQAVTTDLQSVPEFLINPLPLSAFAVAEPIITNDNEIFFAWTSFLQDSSGLGIYARLFDSVGVPLTDELQVNQIVNGDQIFQCQVLSANQIILSWTGGSSDQNSNGIFSRVFDLKSRSFVTNEIVVKKDVSLSFRKLKALLLNNGNVMLLSLESVIGTSNNFLHHIAIVKPNGQVVFNNRTFSNGIVVSIFAAKLENENIFIAWDAASGPPYSIKATVLDQNGGIVVPEFLVATGLTSTTEIFCEDVVVLDATKVMVSWQDRRNGRDVFAKLFNESGQALTTEFQFNSEQGATSGALFAIHSNQLLGFFGSSPIDATFFRTFSLATLNFTNNQTLIEQSIAPNSAYGILPKNQQETLLFRSISLGGQLLFITNPKFLATPPSSPNTEYAVTLPKLQGELADTSGILGITRSAFFPNGDLLTAWGYQNTTTGSNFMFGWIFKFLKVQNLSQHVSCKPTELCALGPMLLSDGLSTEVVAKFLLGTPSIGHLSLNGNSTFNMTSSYDASSGELTLSGDKQQVKAALNQGIQLVLEPTFQGNITITSTIEDGASEPLQGTSVISQFNKSPLLVGSIANQNVDVGTAFHFEVSPELFQDPEGQALKYAATQADGGTLPSWLSFDEKKLSFFGTAPDSGVTTLELKASDPGQLSATGRFDLSVSSGGGGVLGGINEGGLWGLIGGTVAAAAIVVTGVVAAVFAYRRRHKKPTGLPNDENETEMVKIPETSVELPRMPQVENKFLVSGGLGRLPGWKDIEQHPTFPYIPTNVMLEEREGNQEQNSNRPLPPVPGKRGFFSSRPLPATPKTSQAPVAKNTATIPQPKKLNNVTYY